MELLEISSEDITKLNDADLRTLIGRLCEAEYRALGLSTNCIYWGGEQDAPDGGLDVVIRGASSLPQNSFLPRAVVGFQVKKPDMTPAEILKEMKPRNNEVRDSIKALGNQGAYIIVSSKKSLSESTYQRRIAAMQEAIKNEEYFPGFFLDFYDSNRVATWVRNHPSLILWVRNKINRPLKGWRAYESWSDPACDKAEEYIGYDKINLIDNTINTLDNDPINNGIPKLRNTLSEPGAIVRLVGVAGVGKTRLVQALFDERLGTNALNYLQVYYTDLADSPEPDPINFAEQLKACEARSILVVDNCPIELHNRLVQFCKNTLISLISIEYDIRDDLPNETDVFKLEAGSEEIIEKLIEKRFALVSQVDAEQIAKFSGGNAKIAIALANTVKRSGSLAGLRDEELFRRLFQQRQDTNEQLERCAEILSLVYSFDGVDLDSDESELKFLASIRNKTSLDLYQAIKILKDRGLLQSRGKWRAILPPAIANRLAKNALEILPRENIVNHFTELGSERLISSFARRLSYLHDCSEAILIAEEWLSSEGWLGKKDYPFTELEIHVFRNIAPIRPELALEFIEKLVNSNEKKPVLSENNNCYYELIRVLRQLAYESELFDRCVHVLIHFSLMEKVEYGRDSRYARATLRSLFFLYFSGTHASMEQRANVINTLISSDLEQENELGLFLLEATLESEYFSPYYEFNFGARTRNYGLHPKAQQDIVQWYTTFVDLIRLLALSDKSISYEARRIFAQKLYGLWFKTKMFELLESSVLKIYKHTAGQWGEVWIAFQRILKNRKDLSDQNILENTLRLEHEIRPNSLINRSRALLLLALHQYIDITNSYGDEKNIHDRLEETNELVESVGKEMAIDQSALDVFLPELFSMPNTRHTFFGLGLAKGSNDKWALWNKLIIQFGIASFRDGNLGVLCGFISGCFNDDLITYNKIMDGAVENKTIGRYFPILQASQGVDNKALERLHKSLSLNIAKVDTFIHLAYRGIPKSIKDDDLANLLQVLSAKTGGDRVAVEILSMRFHVEKNETVNYSNDLFVVACTTLANFNFNNPDKQTGLNDHLDYSLSRIIDTVLSKNEAQESALEVNKNFMEAINNYSIYAINYLRVLNSLASTQPEIFLNVLLGHFELDKDYPRAKLFKFVEGESRALDFISMDTLICWCNLDSKKRYPLIASVASIFKENQESKTLSLNPLVYPILQNAPDLSQVLSEFSQSIWPMSWNGSLAKELEDRSNLLESLLELENEEIKDWARKQVSFLKEQIFKNREKESQSNERFE
ncbi:TPA: hypothetical protein ACMGHP_002620 [Legionella pneumophila]|nr:hypothetical protein [Legionella pneumophila]HCX3330769.1 hypothetical protein [Legionella pneumophila]